MTRMSKANARRATSLPILPKPTTPSVLSASWLPMYDLRSQRPSTKLW